MKKLADISQFESLINTSAVVNNEWPGHGVVGGIKKYLDKYSAKKGRKASIKAGKALLIDEIQKKLESDPENKYYQDLQELLLADLYKDDDYFASITSDSSLPELELPKSLSELTDDELVKRVMDREDEVGNLPEDKYEQAWNRAYEQIIRLILSRARTNPQILYTLPVFIDEHPKKIAPMVDDPQWIGEDIDYLYSSLLYPEKMWGDLGNADEEKLKAIREQSDEDLEDIRQALKEPSLLRLIKKYKNMTPELKQFLKKIPAFKRADDSLFSVNTGN